MKSKKETVQDRRAICEACPFRIAGPMKVADLCGKCGCVIAAKTSLLGASCPVGKW